MGFTHMIFSSRLDIGCISYYFAYGEGFNPSLSFLLRHHGLDYSDKICIICNGVIRQRSGVTLGKCRHAVGLDIMAQG